MSQLYSTRYCVLLLAGAMVAVQPTPTHALELDDYVTEVVESNPVIREQVHNYCQVAQDYRIALASWRPSLDLEASAGRFSREAPNTSQTRKDFTSSEATLTLPQNLFAGFDITHEMCQAQALMADFHYEHVLTLLGVVKPGFPWGCSGAPSNWPATSCGGRRAKICSTV